MEVSVNIVKKSENECKFVKKYKKKSEKNKAEVDVNRKLM